MSNVSVVRDTLYRTKQKIDSIIDDRIMNMSKLLFERMCDMKFYAGFTGNTQRSYSVGYFMDGDLRFFIQGKDKWTANEIRLKVKKGKKVHLSTPYEGNERTVEGATDVDDYYGFETAREYIMSQPKLRTGFQVIAGVGTEYYSLIHERGRTMNEDIDYILNQDALWESFVNQVKAASKQL